jgi:flagellar hook assembly protein FlgD
VVSYSVGHRITAIEKEKTQNSTDFGVTQNFPNPFNSSTVINFTIPRVDHVTIKIFNLAGEELTTIQNGVLSAGRHQIRWQPLDLTSGTYFYRLQTSDLVDTKKLVLIR